MSGWVKNKNSRKYWFQGFPRPLLDLVIFWEASLVSGIMIQEVIGHHNTMTQNKISKKQSTEENFRGNRTSRMTCMHVSDTAVIWGLRLTFQLDWLRNCPQNFFLCAQEGHRSVTWNAMSAVWGFLPTLRGTVPNSASQPQWASSSALP